MQAVATQKFIKMAPRKLRLVADMVRGKGVAESLEFLPFVPRHAAPAILKVIKTASANAVAKGATGELTISGIEISEGPMLKRFRPVSRGQAHGYVKKMSHIKVVVETAKPKNQNKKTAKVNKQ